MESDSIVALVTPPGEGGVGIVRVSGSLSTVLPERLFPGLSNRWESHRLRHGRLTDPASQTPIDDAMGCVMRAPHSYTGEDVFEIHCHGSPLVLERVVRLCLSDGCRAARPGEFTLRAFLNGRLDLAQAEAVVDVVRAQTNAGLDLAMRQLAGWLSEKIEPVRQTLVGSLAHMEAMVDFVEDDIPPQIDAARIAHLEDALTHIVKLLNGAEQGAILRGGATLAIVGSPNVGKSSIMNGLLGMDRSIVTPIAGTTRDTIEESLQVRGIPFRAVDTAGITRTVDPVEQIGIDRSLQALGTADVVLLVLDRSRPLSEQDVATFEALVDVSPYPPTASSINGRGEDSVTTASLPSSPPAGGYSAWNGPGVRGYESPRTSSGRSARLIVALNKSDLPAQLDLELALGSLSPVRVVESNTVTTGGLDDIRDALEIAALGSARHEFVVSNVRHQDALQRSADALRAAIDGLQQGLPLDLVSFDVRASVQALGEVTGANVDDELLDRIFRDFCIGK